MNILLDTSILIDFYRKERKEKSPFSVLVNAGHSFSLSAITEYEILVGSDESKDSFWRDFFKHMRILPVSSEVVSEAIFIYPTLKKANQLIDIPDLLIGATARHPGLPLATLNTKHFQRIERLTLVLE